MLSKQIHKGKKLRLRLSRLKQKRKNPYQENPVMPMKKLRKRRLMNQLQLSDRFRIVRDKSEVFFSDMEGNA